MTGDRLELRGLRISGRVGVLPFERAQDQPLEIDLDVLCDLSMAGASDALDDTLDYGKLCGVVESTVQGEPAALLEHLAERIAQGVLGFDPRVEGVVLSLRKLRPPVPQDLATAGVRIERRR